MTQKVTRKWGLVFVLALLLSSGGHWLWHQWEDASLPGMSGDGLSVTVCEPPFCEGEEPAPSRSAATSAVHSRQEPGVSGTYLADDIDEIEQPSVSEPDAAAGVLTNASHVVCVYDALSSSGRDWRWLLQWQQAAVSEGGFRPSLVAYVDPGQISGALVEGECDAAWMPAALGEPDWPASVSLEAPGGLPDFSHMDTVSQVLVNERSRDWLVSNESEVIGWLFAGQSYLFLSRAPDGQHVASWFTGKVIGAVNEIQARMINEAGGTAARLDAIRATGAFNNGSIDGLFAPLADYSILELFKGLQPDGVVIDFAFETGMRQLLAKANAFTSDQASWSRAFFLAMQAEVPALLDEDRSSVPQDKLYEVSDDARAEGKVFLRDIRIHARDDGLYDQRILALMRKVRCKLDASLAECINPIE